MANVFKFLLRLVRREKTLEHIMAASEKIVRDLDQHAARFDEKREATEAEIQRLKAQAAAETAEVQIATELASNWKKSGLVRPIAQLADAA